MTACNKDILNRLKRTEGQLRGIQKMRRCHHAIVRRQFQRQPYYGDHCR